MANAITNIETEILNQIRTKAAFDANNTFAYEPFNIRGSPIVTLFYAGWENADEVMSDETKVHRWIIRLYVRMDDWEAAQDALKGYVLDLENALHSDRTLNRTCLWSTLMNGEVYIVPDDVAENFFLVAKMELQARER